MPTICGSGTIPPPPLLATVWALCCPFGFGEYFCQLSYPLSQLASVETKPWVSLDLGFSPFLL